MAIALDFHGGINPLRTFLVYVYMTSSLNSEVALTTADADYAMDLMMLQITNGSASAQTNIMVKDVTGGTVRLRPGLPATLGAQVVYNFFPYGLKQAAKNTAWVVQAAGATAVYYTALFMKTASA